MNTFSLPAPPSLLERVRQRLQHSLAVPIRPQAAGPAEAQVWQIGPGIRLLATPPPAGPGPADCPTLLVYDYVPGELGAQLRAQGTYYADAAGNAWLRHPALLVSVQGCGRPGASARTPVVASPARHVQLLRLLFQLVVRPELAAYSVPNMAACTQLPVAVVRQVVRSLAGQGFWDGSAPLGLSPLLLPTPARYWLTHYPSTLRRRLNGHRYRPRRPTALADWWPQPLPAGCWWGGAAAAHLLLHRPDAPTGLTLYSRLPRAQLVPLLDLVPDTKGPIEILNSFAPATYFAPADDRCVPLLLVYADLLASATPTSETLARALQAHYPAELPA